MKAKINCPHCKVVLVVPAEAGGRKARCSNCSNPFEIPDIQAAIDSMATNWLEMDAIDEDEDDGIPAKPPGPSPNQIADRNTANQKEAPICRDTNAELKGLIEQEYAGGDRFNLENTMEDLHPTPSPIAADESPDPGDSDLDSSIDELDDELGAQLSAQSSGTMESVDGAESPQDSAPAAQAPAPEPSPPPAPDPMPESEPGAAALTLRRGPDPDPEPIELEGDDDDDGGAIPMDEPAAAEAAAPPVALGSAEPPVTKESATGWARKIRWGESRLTVLEQSMDGVVIGFSSTLLGEPAFRASMPLKCLYSQSEAVEELVARPMWWRDRSNEGITDGVQAAAEYEIDLSQHSGVKTVADVIELMRSIDELKPPFSEPMPYFVSKRYAGLARVKAHIQPCEEGICCSIHIPSGTTGPVAVEWLGRINGVMDGDYLDLEKKVSRTHEMWRTIPAKVREHLTGWFDFEPEEEFLFYCLDAEFSAKDLGMAGLVLTDRRIVWRKYKKGGVIDLQPEAKLEARIDGNFADLVYHGESGPIKTIRAKLGEAKTLSGLLDDVDAGVYLVQSEPSASA